MIFDDDEYCGSLRLMHPFPGLMEFHIPFNFISLFLFLVLSSILVKQWKKNKSLNPKKKLPPGPRKLPLIGNLHNLMIGGLPHHILRDLSRKYGPLMHLQFGQVPAIVVSSPRVAKEVMKTHDLTFATRPDNLAGEVMFYGSTDIVFAKYGEYWRQMRKVSVLELFSAKNVRSFGSIRMDEASRMIASIRESAGKQVNLSTKLAKYTSSVVCRAAFGRLCRDQHEFIQLVDQASVLAAGFDIGDLFPSFKFLQFVTGLKPKLMKVHRKVDVILDDVINEHRKNMATGNGEYGEEDLTDSLLRIQESGDLQFPISNNNIKAILFDVFGAGTETSSTLTEWALSELMKNPHTMSKVQTEVRQAFKGKKTILEADLQGLRYLKCVIKETLRLHLAAPLLVPRECREDCELDGYFIPKKSKVLVNAWAIGRDPEYWADAERFMPERFEQSSTDFTGNHFEFIPFGAGRRICPGMLFGIANVELPIALLLYHFNWKLPDGITSDTLDMTETWGITTPRKYDLKLIPTLYDLSLDISC